jgi:hypothetical protein
MFEMIPNIAEGSSSTGKEITHTVPNKDFKGGEEPIYRTQRSQTRTNRSNSVESSKTRYVRETSQVFNKGGVLVEVKPEDTPPLLEGERVVGFYKDIQMVSRHISEIRIPIKGNLVITNFRLYFKSDRSELKNGLIKEQFPSALLNIPLGLINTIKKIGIVDDDCSNLTHGIKIDCKDMRTFKFIMDKPCNSGKNLKKFTPNTFGPELFNFLLRFAIKHPDGRSKWFSAPNMSRQKSRSIE